jgi:hypothetical protein
MHSYLHKKFYSCKKWVLQKKKKKKFQKIMSRACAALSDFDFLSDDSSSSEEDEKVKCKKGDITGLRLMTKGGSLWNVSDSNSNVSEDLCGTSFLESCQA